MKTIVVISFSNLATDPRVNRQIRFLSEHYRVIAVGLSDPKLNNIQFIPVTKTKSMVRIILFSLELLFRSYEGWYWGQKPIIDCLEKLSDIRADLMLANDIDSLPLALKLAKGSKVIFDAHEYVPKENEDSLFWRIVFQRYKTYLCKNYIPQVNGMTTVCQGIADTYDKEFGIKPVVITNAADFEDLNPNLLDENRRSIRLIHHGAAGPSRKIENMIKMMDYLDERFELNLMLIEAWPGYLRRLRRHSKGKPNIHFLPPVPMRTLPRFLNQFDMGVYILEPTSFNFLHTLPNKFFEFIQGRLGIAIGPSPEMARIVKEYDLGVVAEDFSPKALAHCLLELDDPKVNYYKLQSHKVAHFMSAEQNRKILLNLVHQVLQG